MLANAKNMSRANKIPVQLKDLPEGWIVVHGPMRVDTPSLADEIVEMYAVRKPNGDEDYLFRRRGK